MRRVPDRYRSRALLNEHNYNILSGEYQMSAPTPLDRDTDEDPSNRDPGWGTLANGTGAEGRARGHA